MCPQGTSSDFPFCPCLFRINEVWDPALSAHWLGGFLLLGYQTQSCGKTITEASDLHISSLSLLLPWKKELLHVVGEALMEECVAEEVSWGRRLHDSRELQQETWVNSYQSWAQKVPALIGWC